MSASLTSGVIIITRADVRRVMKPADYLAPVEQAFRAAISGKAYSPQPMHLPMPGGGFHAKGAMFSPGRSYVAVKINANFPDNPVELGLPTIQGAIVLFDGANGTLLAILDSTEVTLRRTAAATALAMKLLARPESRTLLICGCGEQGRAHAEVLGHVLPIERVLLWDRDYVRAKQLASQLNGTMVDDLASAASSADVIVTCTPAVKPFMDTGFVEPGTFIAAVGADSPDKCEIAPGLMAAATIVTDATAQCAEMGDLHHAIDAGAMTAADVHSELADVLVGIKAGRKSPDEIIIFDSTGTGLQDVAAAAAIYERFTGDDTVLSVALSAV